MRPEIVYVAGRIFFDEKGKWVYESYNHCFTNDRFADLGSTLSSIYEHSESEVAYQRE